MPAESDAELAALKEKLLTMASYAEAAVNRAIKSLIRRDDDLARQTREDDDLIDGLELEIDHVAFCLLERHPSLEQVRLLAVIVKIARNLERVGDEATTISRRVLELSQEPQLPQAQELPRMAGLSLQLLKDALDAFVHRDATRARSVIPRDQPVDDLNRLMHAQLAALMVERPSTITRCLNLMVICKSLERIADHATNIAEEAVYLCEGRDIRHAGSAKVAAQRLRPNS